MNDKFDWFMEHMFGFIVGGIFAGVIGGGIVNLFNNNKSRDELYVTCLDNMKNRSVDQLEMMCAHLRAKP